MKRPAPERLPSELECVELRQRHNIWIRLSPELFRCPTDRSNHTFDAVIYRMNRNPGRPVMLLIHGVLSDHGMWEYVTPDLLNDYEVWLVDLPGCGESDAPDPSSIEPDGYSPTAMAERVLQAIQYMQGLQANDPARPIILVGHSLGGTVCIRMLSAPELRSRYASVLDRVERMVLFAPSDLAINSVPPSFLKLIELEGWQVDAARVFGIWEPMVRDLTKASFHRPECATVEQQERFSHALMDAGHRKAAIAMLLEFVSFDFKTRRPIWPKIDPLVADYRNIRVPVLIVHGAWDETISVAVGHKLKDQIPGASLAEVARSGHSLPTEQPARCTDLIRQYVTTGVVSMPGTS